MTSSRAGLRDGALSGSGPQSDHAMCRRTCRPRSAACAPASDRLRTSLPHGVHIERTPPRAGSGIRAGGGRARASGPGGAGMAAGRGQAGRGQPRLGQARRAGGARAGAGTTVDKVPSQRSERRGEADRPTRVRHSGPPNGGPISRCRGAPRSASPGPFGRWGRSRRIRSASRTRGRRCPGRPGSSRPTRSPNPGSAAPGTG